MRALARIDHFDRFVSVLVYVPRENYDSVVREKIGHYLADVFQGHVSAIIQPSRKVARPRVHISSSVAVTARPSDCQSKLEEAIRDISTPWEEQFAALAGPQSAGTGNHLCLQEAFSPAETVGDLDDILACGQGEQIRIALYERKLADENRTVLCHSRFSMRWPPSAVTPRSTSGKSRLPGGQRADIRPFLKGR